MDEADSGGQNGAGIVCFEAVLGEKRFKMWPVFFLNFFEEMCGFGTSVKGVKTDSIINLF
jgi:hypothetical protein